MWDSDVVDAETKFGFINLLSNFRFFWKQEFKGLKLCFDFVGLLIFVKILSETVCAHNTQLVFWFNPSMFLFNVIVNTFLIQGVKFSELDSKNISKL